MQGAYVSPVLWEGLVNYIPILTRRTATLQLTRATLTW